MSIDGDAGLSAKLAATRLDLRRWKLVSVGLLVALTGVLTAGGWYVSKVRRSARTVHLQDGTNFRLVDKNGITHEVRYEERNGVLVKITVYRDQNGRKLREVKSLEDAWNAQSAMGP